MPTDREMELWAELQATKDTLRVTEDEVNACKREKVRFLETLTKISVSSLMTETMSSVTKKLSLGCIASTRISFSVTYSRAF